MKETITSDDILGKKAVDSDGEILGVVISLHIDNKEKKILGITVDQGFMKPDLYIGLEYVRHFGVDAVLLNHYPLEKLKGLGVYTVKGRYLGDVVKFTGSGSKLNSITFNKRFRKPETVVVTEIKEIGRSIILKEGFTREKPIEA